MKQKYDPTMISGEDATKDKQFICTRYYSIDAKNEEEAQEILRENENDIDFLTKEEWEEASI